MVEKPSDDKDISRVSVSDFLGVGPPMPPLRPPLHNLLVGGPGGPEM